jgi:collagen type I/II/III/V/XI/XXIV/XXVII alpha
MTTTLDVASETDLNSAISTIDAASSGASYLIEFTSGFTESSALIAIVENAGVTTTINGGGNTLDGASTYQGLFVYSGVVTVQNLTIAHTLAKGGDGGGGGAGFGGGLFIAGTNSGFATGGTVTLSAVNFTGDGATGGAGGSGGAGGNLSGSTLGFGLGGAAGGSSGLPGGFGGGGGTGFSTGGQGGFGGGGGASVSNGGGPGGGGLGAGADIFVQQGGSLIIEGGVLSAGTVTGGAGAGSPSAFGSGIFLQGNQTITLAPGAGQTLTVDGVIADQTGSGFGAGAGGIAAGTGGGSIVFGAVDTYTGTTSLGGGTTLELESGASALASTLTFTGAGTLQLDSLASKVNNITSFAGATETLHFSGIAPGSVTITESTPNTATVDGMVVTGTFGSLSKVSDGAGGTLVTAACFREGTRIATMRGEVAIETVRVGDLARTSLGAHRPVVWIGYRAVEIARHPRPQDVMPVRVRAHAFDAGQPSRDLFLSPDHAVYLDGVLIPVRYLLNGASIAQVPASRVTWWHVELDAHDTVLAEGLPTESYLDTGNRGAFANGGPVVHAHPDFSRSTALAVWDARACAPLVTDGAAVEAMRARLIDRLASLGHHTTTDPDLRVLAGDAPLDVQEDGEWFRCAVPPGVRTLRLVSRATHPAELHADSADWRRLGVAVTGLRLDGADIAFDDPRLGAGWLAAEPGMRWTDGDATLDVPSTGMLELRVWRSLRFHADSEVAPTPQAACWGPAARHATVAP